MTRILHLIPGLNGGGAERQLTLVAPAQAERGHSVHIGIVAGDVPKSLHGVPNVHVHQLPLQGNHDPLLVPRLYRLIRTAQADVVQTWLVLMDIMGASAATLARTPWVLSERSETAAYPPTLKNRVRLRVGLRANAIVANSQGGVTYWTNSGAKTHRLSMIPNAVDADGMRNATVLPLPAECVGRPLVLFVGRLSEEKQPFVLVDALARALPQIPAAAMLCGTGPLAGAVQHDIDERGLHDRIVLAGHRSDVHGLLKHAKVCVAISRFEGSPNVVLEAMAAGCPLIVTDIPAYRALLDESCALFVPVNDASATAAAILNTLQQQESAEIRAINARNRTAVISPAGVAASLDDVYERVLGASQ